MKFLIVGMGSIGKRHFANITDLKHTCIGIDSYGEFRENIDKVDAVVVCSPTNTHIEYAIECIRHNKHVFIEKPVATDMASINPLRATIAEKIEKNIMPVIQVGYNLRHHPIIKELKERILKNEFGKIYSVLIECGMYMPDWRNKNYTEYYSSHKDQGGGVVLDLSHEIDYILWLFGLPIRVIGYTNKVSNLDIDCEDVADAVLIMLDGLHINIHLDYLQKKRTRMIKLITEKGEFLYSLDELSEEDRNSLYVTEMKDFIYCIENKKVPTPDIIDGLVVVYICNMIKKNVAMQTKFGKKGGFRW